MHTRLQQKNWWKRRTFVPHEVPYTKKVHKWSSIGSNTYFSAGQSAAVAITTAPLFCRWPALLVRFSFVSILFSHGSMGVGIWRRQTVDSAANFYGTSVFVPIHYWEVVSFTNYTKITQYFVLVMQYYILSHVINLAPLKIQKTVNSYSRYHFEFSYICYFLVPVIIDK